MVLLLAPLSFTTQKTFHPIVKNVILPGKKRGVEGNLTGELAS